MASNGVSIFSAAVSVVAAGIATYQAHTAQTVPFRAALYTARANALSSYVLASGNLQSAIAKARVDLPFDVEQPGSIAADTDAQMQANAVASSLVINSHGAYLPVVNASIPMWSNETRAKIGRSISASKAASDCFVQLGSHTRDMPAWYWAQTKIRAEPSCLALRGAIATFAQSVAEAEGAMIAELRRTESEDVPPGIGANAGTF